MRKSRILITKEIDAAAELMLSDRALAYPTETFYGLGCSALSAKALDALASWKPRDPQAKPYPLILGDRSQLGQIMAEDAKAPLVDTLLDGLVEAFWPGPLTLVLPGLSTLDHRICSPEGGVAVRVSSHPAARALALAVGQPIVSTSANPAGQPPPRTPEDVLAGFAPRQLDILDGGVCHGGAPSTILSLLGETPVILRPGAITPEQLAACGLLSPWQDLLWGESADG